MPGEKPPRTVEELTEELEKVKAERDAAAADIARIIWLSGLCKYCAHCKGSQHKHLDNPCRVCEPKWRGMKGRR